MQELPVPEFPGYFVTNNGEIWSNRHSGFSQQKRMLKPYVNKDGHLSYRLYDGQGNGHAKYGHQLVLIAFRGPCPIGLECCHKDGNPANNKLSNLRWGTKKSNADDCIRHGRRPRGEIHGRAKIRESDVPTIVDLVAQGNSKASVGRLFGISGTQVLRICSGNQWKHTRR